MQFTYAHLWLLQNTDCHVLHRDWKRTACIISEEKHWLNVAGIVCYSGVGPLNCCTSEICPSSVFRVRP